MTGHEIRQKFLDYFAERAHRPVRSSSLVPAQRSDTAVHQRRHEPVQGRLPWARKSATIRARHLRRNASAPAANTTISKMSATRAGTIRFLRCSATSRFGDYFKAEAIDFAWDLLTKEYGLPKDKLYVTVFREDDEAEELWQKVAGVPKDRIFRLDEKDNFWQMGETGPCGPCSEIHYDLGRRSRRARPRARSSSRRMAAAVSSRSGTWSSCSSTARLTGVLTPLPRPSIDTGMGLERIAAVLQGKLTNYETDLIRPIIEHAAELFDIEYGAERSHRHRAPHLRRSRPRRCVPDQRWRHSVQ